MLCIVPSEVRNSTDPPRINAITCGTYLQPTWSITTGAGIGTVADIAAGGPLLIYTYTFASLPSCTTYCWAKLSPPVIEHTGSMLMSIFTGAGGLPERWIVPLTVPNVAGSSGALAGAGPSALVPL